MRQVDQVVGRPAHRREDADDVVPRVARRNEPPRDRLQPFRPGDGCAAELLDDETHGETLPASTLGPRRGRERSNRSGLEVGGKVAGSGGHRRGLETRALRTGTLPRRRRRHRPAPEDVAALAAVLAVLPEQPGIAGRGCRSLTEGAAPAAHAHVRTLLATRPRPSRSHACMWREPEMTDRPEGTKRHKLTARRGARAVESGGLENRWARKRPVGSNPTPAAITSGERGDGTGSRGKVRNRRVQTRRLPGEVARGVNSRGSKGGERAPSDRARPPELPSLSPGR